MGLDSWGHLWLTEKLFLVKEESVRARGKAGKSGPSFSEPGHMQVQGRYGGKPLKKN